MSLSLALSWQHTPRYPIARIPATSVRILLQMMTSRGVFPTAALHCDAQVDARDLSVQAHSLATILRAIDADDTVTAIIEEAQFTQTKVRLLTCPVSHEPLLTVSPTIDLDLTSALFPYIANAVTTANGVCDWDNGKIELGALLDALAGQPDSLTTKTFARAAALTESLQQYLSAPRAAYLLWQASDHLAAPLEPVAASPAITRNELVLDAGSGRMFGNIDGPHGRHTICLSGDNTTPTAWNQLLSVSKTGTPEIIGSFCNDGTPCITIVDTRGSRAVPVSFHHDETTRQPTLRLQATPHAHASLRALHA